MQAAASSILRVKAMEPCMVAVRDPSAQGGIPQSTSFTPAPGAIIDLTLARSEGTSQRFYSMSGRLRIERGDYYDTLEAAQRETLDITTRITWFLRVLANALDDAERAIDGHGLLVGAVRRRERVEDVGDRHDARLDRDVARPQVARVAAAVEVLVVRARDARHVGEALPPGDLPEEVVRVHDVALDLDALDVGEAAAADLQRGHLLALDVRPRLVVGAHVRHLADLDEALEPALLE